MRTASLVLGIIGGVLAVIFALIFMAGGALVGSLGGALESEGWVVEGTGDIPLDQAAGYAASYFYIIGGLSIVGAVLGIVGGAMAKKKNILAGIFLIVAAIPSFFTGLGIIASILFIVGGVLALIPQKDKQAVAE